MKFFEEPDAQPPAQPQPSRQKLIITPQVITLFIAQLLRSKALVDEAFRRLLAEHIILAGGTKYQAYIFKALLQYYGAFQTQPDFASLEVYVRQLVLGNDADAQLPDDLVRELSVIRQLLCEKELVNERGERLAWRVLRTILDEYVKAPVVRQLIEQAMVSEAVDGLGQRILEIERQYSVSFGGLAKSAILTPTDDAVGERLTTGLPWLDARFGDGMGIVRGSAVAIIAPQGHGKTTLGIQMGVAQALQHRHALLVLAEEGLSRQIRRRILACTTGIPTYILEKHDRTQDSLEVFLQSQPQYGLIKQKIDAVQQYLHVVDLVSNPGGIETIVLEVHALQQRVGRLAYVYIDWAGPLADYMMSNGINGVMVKSRYEALKRIGAEVAMMAQTADIVAVISQQMASQVFKCGWRHEATTYVAMDCASFTESFKYAFVINPRDPKSNLSWFKVVKARDDPAGVKFIVKLDGSISQFIDVTQQYRYTLSGFRPLYESDDNIAQRIQAYDAAAGLRVIESKGDGDEF